jgi:YggT family protein
MGTVLYTLCVILSRAIDVYILVIVVRSIVSWFRLSYRNPLVRFLFGVTDPVLNPVRDVIHYRLGLRLGGLDVSPVVVILALVAVKRLLLTWLMSLIWTAF